LERLIRAGPLKGADVYVNGARHPFPLRAAKSVANHSTEKF